MAFELNSYPVVYRAKFDDGKWLPEYLEEAGNYYSDMPLVNYTTQYGIGCFEGLKAMPQKDGGLALFRPDRNGERFFKSMEGLYMPGFPAKDFVEACLETVRRNQARGFSVQYKEEWEKDSFKNADAVYIRPFTYAEGGIGVNICREPWVIVITTPVSSYFSGGNSDAIVTERIRATPRGTGWIKAASNYTIAALAKHECQQAGFMECIFLDAIQHKYIEEGSSCNIFFYLKSGELVTPDLEDTILPGITRASIIELAGDRGVKTSERRIAIDEAMENTKECFVTGTAAGLTPIDSITYKGKKVIFNDNKVGELSAELRDTLKGIQYGKIPDTKGWLVRV